MMQPLTPTPFYLSEILSGLSTVQKYANEHQLRLRATVEKFRAQRKALAQRAEAFGLHIIPSNFSDAFDDIFETDDGGKLIDTYFKVSVDSVESVKQAVLFCKQEKVLALPIGAKTSALGVFEARGLAERFGLKGIVGIVFKKLTPEKAAQCISHQNTSDGLVVKAHAAVTIVDINQYLLKNVPSDKFRYRLMPDPTSRWDAQLGGIIATGAEGGNRSQASEDIHRATVVDADGNEHIIEGDDAKRLVGLNGNAGVICAAEFKPTAFPRFDHGLVIPLSGRGRTAWHQALQIQDWLKPYCYSVDSDPRVQVGKGDAGIIVTGIDLLAIDTVKLAVGDDNSRFTQQLLSLTDESDILVFVTFSSFLSSDDERIFSTDFFNQCLKVNLDTIEIDADENYVQIDSKFYKKIRILSSQELPLMDGLRHSAPSHARELARRMGGVSESTDINIRFNAADETENQKALSLVADLYADYAEGFKKTDGFRCLPYGHLHPGVGRGGGIDIHVRAVFELSNPGSRYNAPEQVAELKSRHNNLVKKCLQLHGTYGIEICAPEKGKFASSEYWNWLCLTDELNARKDLELCKRLGIATTESGDQLASIAGRMPHVLPGILRPSKNGVKGLFVSESDSIEISLLKLSTENPKGEKIRRLLSHVLLRAHEYLALDNQQYPFLIESVSEASAILDRNFGEGHGFSIASFNIVDGLLKPAGADSIKTVYVADLAVIGIDGALMIVAQDIIKQAYDLTNSGKNRAVYRNLYELWAGWPFETMEAPNVIAFGMLGLWLDRDRLSNQRISKKPLSIASADVIGAVHPSLFLSPQSRADSNQNDAQKQQQCIAEFKSSIGLPEEYKIGFCASATQGMQLLTDLLMTAPKDVQVIQVVNDASGARWNSIMKKAGIPVKTIVSSWTTAENSELKSIAEKISQALATASVSVLCITPHKTSTTADVLPDHIIRELSRLGFRLGKDYFFVCDITSGVGVRNYQTLVSPDTGMMRVPFHGCFGSGNRSLGIPAGFGFVSISPALLRVLQSPAASQNEFSLSARFARADAGTCSQSMYLGYLAAKLAADSSNLLSVAGYEFESREKMNLVLGWLEKHPDLICLVPNSFDRSPLMVGIFSQAKNMIVAKRLLSEIFGIRVGAGFGPFEREGFRLFVPHLSRKELLELLASLDIILELDDVVHSRGENIPNIALREPHDPLSVIQRVAKECTIDDLIKDQLGLDWLGRLIRTFNANTEHPDEQVQVAGKIPRISTGHKIKAKIYGESNNVIEMRKILALKNEETRLDLTFHYTLFKEAEEHIRSRVLGTPDATWNDRDFVAAINYLLAKVREHLFEIARLLQKYVDGDAARDSDGRVEWPIVA